MKANSLSILNIFGEKIQMEVPLFQRQYVWNLAEQWEPLWEDISRKVNEYLDGHLDRPVHFLGAIVLDQKQTPTGHVNKRQVIDGQQRITTLQIFMAAFRDFCREQGCEQTANDCEKYTLNTGTMAKPEVEKFKVWPTQADRKQFEDVLTANSPAELETRYPLIRIKYTSRMAPRPRMVEAYLYFYGALTEMFAPSDTSDADINETEITRDIPLEEQLDTAFLAMKNGLQIVVIDLEQGDDAQVIFETLNARGQPLLPADLLRNFIFLRAARAGDDPEALYNEYWKDFDDAFWSEKAGQGRLSRPRSDLFLQHYLASRQDDEISIKRLFTHYKHWIDKSKPFSTVREELITLSKQSAAFRRLLEPKENDPLYSLAVFLQVFDISTVYPLLLFLMDADIAASEMDAIAKTLESYLLRRAVCNMTTKNYNRIFLILLRRLRESSAERAEVSNYLSELRGESGEWPNDRLFRAAWRENGVYLTLNNPKLVYILSRLNQSYLNRKNEIIRIDSPLTVEHILPQSWTEHWPLPDGSKGLTTAQIYDNANQDDPLLVASQKRNEALQTMGNLTILSQSLNSSVSNAAWEDKKPELLRFSLLPINQNMFGADVWDEAAIEQRSAELFEKAVAIWSVPSK